MRCPSALACGVLALVAACTAAPTPVAEAPPPPPPPPAPVLAYQAAAPSTLRYVRGDTAQVDVEVGGQSFPLTISLRGVLDVALAPDPAGVLVTATFRELDARATNPMSPDQTAGLGGVTGGLVFTMDARGEVAILGTPVVAGDAVDFVSPISIAHDLFPALPGRGARPGDSWVDTVEYASSDANGRLSARAVATYTVAGDTVVGGRTLVLVRSRADAERRAEGSNAGVPFTQSARGPVDGWFLWDPARGLVVEVAESGDLRGTMEVAVAPAPLPIRVRLRSWTRLDEG